MSKLQDYIHVYDDVMTKETCDHLISLYDAAEPKTHMLTETYDFYEVNMMRNHAFRAVREQFTGLMGGIYEKYSSQFEFFPKTKNFEQPRIKRYEPNESIFRWHCVATTPESYHRLLVMFFYLNDVEEGGETKFRFEPSGEEIAIKPKAGSVVCFPPTWQYPHSGSIPISGPKYVISSYAWI